MLCTVWSPIALKIYIRVNFNNLFVISKLLTKKLQNKKNQKYRIWKITPCTLQHFHWRNFYSIKQHDRFQFICVSVPPSTELENKMKKRVFLPLIQKRKIMAVEKKRLNKILTFLPVLIKLISQGSTFGGWPSK